MAGYRAGLDEAGLAEDPELVVRAEPAGDEGDFGSLAGYRAARALLRVRPRPTAIFAADDFVALGAMQALEEEGVRVPEDVSLVGFDDVQFSGLRRISLTTVCQPRAMMGERVAELVLDRLEGREPASPVEVTFEPELIVRSTTAPPPG